MLGYYRIYHGNSPFFKYVQWEISPFRWSCKIGCAIFSCEKPSHAGQDWQGPRDLPSAQIQYTSNYPLEPFPIMAGLWHWFAFNLSCCKVLNIKKKFCQSDTNVENPTKWRWFSLNSHAFSEWCVFFDPKIPVNGRRNRSVILFAKQCFFAMLSRKPPFHQP